MSTAETPQPLVTYKGFNSDWTCRDYQFEVGGTYTHDGAVVRCAAGGFHSCKMPLDVLRYYPATKSSKFAETQCAGQIDATTDGDSKIASAVITIRAELRLPDLIKRAVRWVIERANGCVGTGDYGHAAATGHYGHAAATGRSGHAAATGDSGHAAATGHYGHAAATGHSGHAAATGRSGVAVALGERGTAKAGPGGTIVLRWYSRKRKAWRVKVGYVGERGIQEGKVYRVVRGKFVEVQP